MILTNAGKVREFWRLVGTSTDEQPTVPVVVLIRHQLKLGTEDPMEDLSEVGAERARMMLLAMSAEILDRNLRERCTFASSRPERNINTLRFMFAIERTEISTPDSLNLINLGPNGEDFIAAKTLVAMFPHRYSTPNQASLYLEDHRIVRVGEHPIYARSRVRQGIITMMTDVWRPGKLIVISINSPTGNEAVGVDGVLKEGEALFLTYDPTTNEFTLLDRVAPEFSDEPAPTV